MENPETTFTIAESDSPHYSRRSGSPTSGFRFTPLQATSSRTAANSALAAVGIGKIACLRALNRADQAPYHNSYHADCLIIQAEEAVRYYMARGVSVNAKALLAAAFFHDFNHSAGEFDDDYNIAQACATVAGYLPSTTGASVAEVKAVCALIRTTRYPFSPVDPEAIEARILRDADMMQLFEDDAVARIRQYDGLRDELSRLNGTTITRTEFARGMCDWSRANVRWLSQWGSERAAALDFAGRCESTARSMYTLKDFVS